MKFEQRLVKISEAKELIEAAAERVKAGETDLKKSLSANISMVKMYKGQQGVTDETMIPLMIETEETSAEVNAEILKELSDLKKSVGELKPSIAELKKETSAPNTLDLINETIDGMVSGLESLKTKANSGTGVTSDELTAVWPGYETRELISGLMATLNNMQKAVDIFVEVKSPIEDALKKGDEGGSDGGQGDGDGSGDDSGNDDNPDGGTGEDGKDKPNTDDGAGGDGGGDPGNTGDDGQGDGPGEEGGDGGGDVGSKGNGDADELISSMDLSPPLESGGKATVDAAGEVEIEG